MKIELTTSPSAEDAETISQGLVNFNLEAAKNLDPEETETEVFCLRS